MPSNIFKIVKQSYLEITIFHYHDKLAFPNNLEWFNKLETVEMGDIKQSEWNDKIYYAICDFFFLATQLQTAQNSLNYFRRSHIETPMLLPHNDVDERLIKYLFVSNTTS